MLIFSIDIDAGSYKVGEINCGKNDRNVHNVLSEVEVGKIESQCLPLLNQIFEDFEVSVTFAVRGQLTEVNDSIMDLFLDSSVVHDIGAHGYYHKNFQEITRDEAMQEIKLVSLGMKKFRIITKFCFSSELSRSS